MMRVEIDEFELLETESNLIEEITGLFIKCVVMQFDYRRIGKYVPATFWQPEEYPETEISDILISKAVLGDDSVIEIDKELTLIIVDNIDYRRMEEIGDCEYEAEEWGRIKAKRFP